MTLSILLAFICSWALLKPHLLRTSGDVALESGELEYLLEQKARCIQVLRDLELDYRTQKVSSTDYEQMKESISVELSTLIEKLDKHV